MFKFIFLLMLSAHALAASGDCVKNNLSTDMCPGNGFCTYYPLGEEGQSCGTAWSIPKNWVALDVDCISNTKAEGTLSCKSGKGKISVVICGKSNCYKCLCQ
jgi:hypothetical protein